jgi:hypothetical protein
MTSLKALAPTKAFLDDNAYFGLHASQVCVYVCVYVCVRVCVRACACVCVCV